MQAQFTEKAKTALELAKKEAKGLRQSYVGTEHLLLGLLREKSGVAARVLLSNGAKEEAVRNMVRDLIAPEGCLKRTGFPLESATPII